MSEIGKAYVQIRADASRLFDVLDEIAYAEIRPLPPGISPTFLPDCSSAYDHEWYWRSKLPERKGERCRIVARGRLNSIMVEFMDGTRVITSRFAVRRVR